MHKRFRGINDLTSLNILANGIPDNYSMDIAHCTTFEEALSNLSQHVGDSSFFTKRLLCQLEAYPMSTSIFQDKKLAEYQLKVFKIYSTFVLTYSAAPHHFSKYNSEYISTSALEKLEQASVEEGDTFKSNNYVTIVIKIIQSLLQYITRQVSLYEINKLTISNTPRTTKTYMTRFQMV